MSLTRIAHVCLVALLLNGCAHGISSPPDGTHQSARFEQTVKYNRYPSNAAEQLSGLPDVGFVMPQEVLDRTKIGKRIKAEIQDYVSSRQRVIDTEEKNLKSEETNLVKLTGESTEKTRLDEQFRRHTTEFQRKVSQLKVEVEVKKKEVLNEFNKRMGAIVENIAQRKHLLLVLAQAADDPALSLFKSSQNLTELVIGESNAAEK